MNPMSAFGRILLKKSSAIRPNAAIESEQQAVRIEIAYGAAILNQYCAFGAAKSFFNNNDSMWTCEGH